MKWLFKKLKFIKQILSIDKWVVVRPWEDNLLYEIFGPNCIYKLYIPVLKTYWSKRQSNPELYNIPDIDYVSSDLILVLHNGIIYKIPNTDVQLLHNVPKFNTNDPETAELLAELDPAVLDGIDFVNHKIAAAYCLKPVLLKPLKQYKFIGKFWTYVIKKVLKYKLSKVAKQKNSSVIEEDYLSITLGGNTFLVKQAPTVQNCINKRDNSYMFDRYKNNDTGANRS